MLPKWLTPVAATAFFLGGLVLVVGPIVIGMALAPEIEQHLPAEAQEASPQELRQAQYDIIRERHGWVLWVFPIGGALAFGGAIGLLLVWVSRPLGDDLEQERPEA